DSANAGNDSRQARIGEPMHAADTLIDVTADCGPECIIRLRLYPRCRGIKANCRNGTLNARTYRSCELRAARYQVQYEGQDIPLRAHMEERVDSYAGG